MTSYELRVALDLPCRRPVVFDFFADAGNLEELTPPWVHFRIQTPLPLTMRQGALLDYRIRLHGVPVRWRTEITAWDPPLRFVDRQLRGPYLLWNHEHTFTELPPPAETVTRVEDRVLYAVPGGPLAPLVNAVLVAPDLRRIFRYRQRRIVEMLAGGRKTLVSDVTIRRLPLAPGRSVE
jgi:ligand-binding SRPBCC domain-containing protein